MSNIETMQNTTHEEVLESEKTEIFEGQQELMKEIYKTGFEKHAESILNLADAFDLERHKPAEENHKCICCMDERTPFGIHSAGSGILLSDKDFEKYFKESGADSISSHQGCGAAKIYAKKMGLEGDSDIIGKEWAEKKAQEMGVPHLHLTVEKPFHFARVCYYDATGKFNYEGIQGLPEGFVVGRKFMSKEASLAEAGVAKNIIFGDHGFGEELLTKETPFLFVAIANTKSEMETLKNELEELTKSFGENTAIDGFISPKE